jgi:hypothetical protein
MLLMLPLSLGCGSGPKLMRVWGEASFDGKPIEQGEIILFPSEETRGPSVGGPIENGRYDIAAATGPQAGGTYRVEITGLRKGKKYTPAANGEGPVVEPMVNYVPDIYNRRTTLRLTISEVAEENQRDFKLEGVRK